MSKLQLSTTVAKFDALHQAVEKTRGKNVTLPKQDVMNLLMDHSRMTVKLRELVVHIEE